MIFDVLYLIASGALNAVSAVLGFLLPFSLPTAFYSGIAASFATLGFLGGIIDLPVLFQCIFWFLAFEILWITLMLVWYVIGFFRSIFSVGGANGH